MSNKRGPIREFFRSLRLAFYHWRKGPGFDYHGVPIDLPDRIMFTFKRQLMRGNYEEPERALIDKYLDPANAVIELGGSLGIISAYVTSKLDDSTPFSIVEANGAILDVCEKNANWKKRANQANVVHAAIGYDAPTIRFAASDNVHISRVAGENDANTIEVPTISLSKVVADTAGENPYTLVMDIEGMEMDVLRREPAAFKNCALAIIEFHPGMFEQSGTSVEEFFALAQKAGLKTLEVTGNSAAFSAA